MHYEIHFSSGSVWLRRTRTEVVAELRAIRKHNSLDNTTVEYHRWVGEFSSVDRFTAERFLRPDYRRLESGRARS